MSLKTIFFAYEKGNQENVDAITKASKELNRQKKRCRVIRWEDLSISGKIIGTDIFRHIRECDKFVCDLTYLNHNVLFELGYAIAQQKKLKIFLNPTIINAKKNYAELKILKNIGYKEFSNAKDITKELHGATTVEESSLLIDKIIPGHKTVEIDKDIFLINIKNKNQAAIELEEYLSLEYEKFFTNKEDEIAYRPLVWYLNAILKSKMVLLHMLGKEKIDYKVENAEFSLYAGLAYGLGKEVLMLAPEPFHAPIDYTDILVEYSSAEDCLTKTLLWIEQRLKKDFNTVDNNKFQEENEQRELNLLKLGIGEGVAENENNAKTFVEIDAYLEAIKRKKVIITGRKGTGKTEIFMRLKDNLNNEKNHYNIIIKPDSDEMLSNVELTKLYDNTRSKKAFLKTVWQYIIISRIFYQIVGNINKLELTEKEVLDINAYYKNNEDMFVCNFYSMILYITRSFNGYDIIRDPSLLEKIKEKLLPMMNVIHSYFGKMKYQNINILADNLDTGWEIKSDLELQSQMIICLLEYLDELNSIFGGKTNIHSVVFLRKDIFNYILGIAREPDKMIMDAFEINWEKFPKQLKTVIDKRMQNILGGAEDIEKIWQDYFLLRKSKQPFDLIQAYIVKRPRDAIYFIGRLFESAATNNKIQVTDEDFEYAIEEYTKYLYLNLIAELKAEFPKIEIIIKELQRVYAGILKQFTFIPVDNFYKIIQNNLDKEETEKLIKYLLENNYLVVVIKKSNRVINNYDDFISAISERKLKVFKKNKMLFNMKLIPFAE